jgi:hypothetical protein
MQQRYMGNAAGRRPEGSGSGGGEAACRLSRFAIAEPPQAQEGSRMGQANRAGKPWPTVIVAGGSFTHLLQPRNDVTLCHLKRQLVR